MRIRIGKDYIDLKNDKDFLYIENSYMIKNPSLMKEFIDEAKYRCLRTEIVLNKRSTRSIVYEWKAKNLLQFIPIFKNKYKSIFFNLNSRYKEILYFILSVLYI